MARPSLSAVYLISGLFLSASPLTLCGRGRVNGYSIYLSQSHTESDSRPGEHKQTGGHGNDLRLDYWVTKCEDIKASTVSPIDN